MRNIIIAAVAMLAVGLALGFLLGRGPACRTGGLYKADVGVGVERDTVVVVDTVRRYYPRAVERERVRTEFRWLACLPDRRARVRTDTLERLVTDSVLVEVPVESRHYHGEEYDAWVSGYEPSLDSIRVYRRTERVTETVTRTVKDNRPLSLYVGGGAEWSPNSGQWSPTAEVGARLKKGRLGLQVSGGYRHEGGKGEPVVKAGVSYDLVSF